MSASLSDLTLRSLLPSNSGVFERVVSAAQIDESDRRAVLVERLRTLWDPWTCPEDHIPLLAWAWSVDIWNDLWPIDRKREVIAESRAFHERKTTVAGFKMALGYVDAELVRANLPRHAFFSGKAPTVAEHEAWLATLPEIRIYEHTPLSRQGLKGFFCGRSAARNIRNVILDRRRAVLIRDGVETQLVLSGLLRAATGEILSEPERLLMPTPPRRVFRAGGFVGWPVASGALAGLRVITLTFTKGGDAFLPNAIAPSITSASVAPKRIAQARSAGMGLFANRSRYRRGVRVNDAPTAFYSSIRLTDGSSANLSRMRNVITRTRLRRKSYTAGLLVHAPRAPLNSAYPTGHVARKGPAEFIASLNKAVAATQAARDTMFIDINSTRAMRYADLLYLPENAHYGLSIRT